MKDYYKILGVNEDASDEEIRARWVELVKHYHPDLGEGPEDDERVKKINEAYQVLKNGNTRMEYDLERDLKRSFMKKRAKKPMGKGLYIGFGSAGAVIVLLIVFSLFVPKQTPVVIQPKETVKKEVSKEPEVRTEGVSFAAPSPVQEEVSNPRRELLSEPIPKPEAPHRTGSPSKIEPQEVPLKVAKASPPVSQADRIKPERTPPKVNDRKEMVPQVVLPVPKPEAPRPSLPEPAPIVKPSPPKQIEKAPPVEIPKPEAPRTSLPEPAPIVKPSPPKQIEKGLPVEIPKPGAKEKAGSLSKETDKSEPGRLPPVDPLPGVKPVTSPPVARPDRVEMVKPEAREKITAEPKEAAKTAPSLPVRKTEPLAKVEPVVPAPPRKEETKPVLPQEPSAKVEVRVAPPLRPSPEEEEVRQFFARYIDRYARKDIDGFLSFFSAGAIQNKKDGMEGIRKIYTNFFNQSQELQYRLEDPKIESSQRGLVVKARYEVNQTLKKGGTKKTWRGQGQWFLMKEEGKLKVVSLDYQHD